MIVPDAILVAGRRTGRLQAPDEALVGERGEDVVHRLMGDRPDLAAYEVADVVGRAVRLLGHRPQHCQPLGRHLHPVPPEQRIVVHGWVNGWRPRHAGHPNGDYWNQSRFCMATNLRPGTSPRLGGGNVALGAEQFGLQ